MIALDGRNTQTVAEKSNRTSEKLTRRRLHSTFEINQSSSEHNMQATITITDRRGDALCLLVYLVWWPRRWLNR